MGKVMPELCSSSVLWMSGFTDPQINTVYRLDAGVLVADRPTYWSQDHSFFMYTEAVRCKLQISPRWEPVGPYSPPVDMLEDARNGNSRGLAMQIDGDVWYEYVAEAGEWQQLQIQWQVIQDQEMPPPQNETSSTSLRGDAQSWNVGVLAEVEELDVRPSRELPCEVNSLSATALHSTADDSDVMQVPESDSYYEYGGTRRVRPRVALGPKTWAASGLAAGKKEPSTSVLPGLETGGPETEEAVVTWTLNGEVPAFDPNARGTPRDWNEKVQPLFWGRRAQRLFPSLEGACVDIEKVLNFFALRPGPDGRPVSVLLGEPVTKEGGWFQFPWLAFREDILPTSTQGDWGEGKAEWQRAWHGCKMEALYSIMYHGQLAASCDAERGDRFHPQAPGVYCHKDVTMHKAGTYSRCVPLFRDGVFWCAKWELRVDRSDRIPVKRVDQWVQHERSVHLAALWLCGRRCSDMEEGWEVSVSWDPLLEADPRSGRVVGAPPPLAEGCEWDDIVRTLAM